MRNNIISSFLSGIVLAMREPEFPLASGSVLAAVKIPSMQSEDGNVLNDMTLSAGRVFGSPLRPIDVLTDFLEATEYAVQQAYNSNLRKLYFVRPSDPMMVHVAQYAKRVAVEKAEARFVRRLEALAGAGERAARRGGVGIESSDVKALIPVFTLPTTVKLALISGLFNPSQLVQLLEEERVTWLELMESDPSFNTAESPGAGGIINTISTDYTSRFSPKWVPDSRLRVYLEQQIERHITTVMGLTITGINLLVNGQQQGGHWDFRPDVIDDWRRREGGTANFYTLLLTITPDGAVNVVTTQDGKLVVVQLQLPETGDTTIFHYSTYHGGTDYSEYPKFSNTVRGWPPGCAVRVHAYLEDTAFVRSGAGGNMSAAKDQEGAIVLSGMYGTPHGPQEDVSMDATQVLIQDPIHVKKQKAWLGLLGCTLPPPQDKPPEAAEAAGSGGAGRVTRSSKRGSETDDEPPATRSRGTLGM